MKLLAVIVAAFIALASCSSSSTTTTTPPPKGPATAQVTPVGTPSGSIASMEIGPAGGTVVSSDGLLTLTFPANAVDTATMVSVQSISAEAPGAVRAWRLGPEGASFKAPVQLAMKFSDADTHGSAPEALEVGYQKADGVWGVLKQISLDGGGKLLTATTTHFSDWSLLQGLQLLPKDAKALIGESVTLTVNTCALVETGDEVISDLARCEPEDLLLRTADWSVNGTVGGTDALGTITGRETGVGTFVAPSTKPEPSLVSVSTVFTAPNRRGGVKGLLVSNVTIVNEKGWSGQIDYRIDGSKTTDETTTLGANSTQTHTVWVRNGTGTIRFEPSFFPGAMKVVAGSANWSESWEQTRVTTQLEGNCPRVITLVDETHFSGAANDPVNPNAIHLLNITGDKYRMEIGSLQGNATGSSRVAESGKLTGGGTGCTPPVNNDATSAGTSGIPVEVMVIEGDIDPRTPNIIQGSSTVSYGDQLPIDVYTITWQFEL